VGEKEGSEKSLSGFGEFRVMEWKNNQDKGRKPKVSALYLGGFSRALLSFLFCFLSSWGF